MSWSPDELKGGRDIGLLVHDGTAVVALLDAGPKGLNVREIRPKVIDFPGDLSAPLEPMKYIRSAHRRRVKQRRLG